MTCNLDHTEDQRQILNAVDALLASSFPVGRLRERGQDDLSEIAAFGAYALALPEETGGSGFTLVEEALMHTLFGRALVSTNALAAALAVRVATGADLVGSITSGAKTVCCAIADRDRIMLLDGAGATLALVFDGASMRLCDLVATTPRPVDGLGHSLAIAILDAPREIASSTDALAGATADILISAHLLGAAEATRDLAVEYAQVRRQFGKPIGAFQAIKHHCATMAVGAEMLSAQLDMAAISVRDRRSDATFQAAALRRLARRVAQDNARTAIQIHGGIGFSAEADVHHYVKRVHLLHRLGVASDLGTLPAPLPPHRPLSEAARANP